MDCSKWHQRQKEKWPVGVVARIISEGNKIFRKTVSFTFGKKKPNEKQC